MKSGSNPMFRYRIIIKGLLDIDWSLWFEGMQVTPDSVQGVTCINGSARDQAELYGIINLIRDLNLIILKFKQTEDEEYRD
jgi:hypothetical protein